MRSTSDIWFQVKLTFAAAASASLFLRNISSTLRGFRSERLLHPAFLFLLSTGGGGGISLAFEGGGGGGRSSGGGGGGDEGRSKTSRTAGGGGGGAKAVSPFNSVPFILR